MESVARGLSPTDRRYLEMAVEIGRRGWGRVHPNPMVGCVLVNAGEVVGEGWHEGFREAHAEINALRRAGEKARGSTAYVSLEPCNHFGHTPPCSSALVSAGVSRVVYGAEDPGQESSGGAEALGAAGVEVLGPVLSPEEGRRENPAFFFNCQRQATFVALKLAQTLDGRIAEAPGRRTAITGPEARVETHRLRAGFDAVMVGSNTVVADDPLLTVREKVPLRKQPARIVLDGKARMTPAAKAFGDLEAAPLIIFTGPRASEKTVAGWTAAGAMVERVPETESGLALEAVLASCWTRGVRSVLCEGGGRLASSLIRGRLAQRLYLFVAPFVLGEEGVSAFPSLESRGFWEGWRPAATARWFGDDVLLTYDRTG